MYKQFTLIIDFGRIYLYIGADITWWSIGCPFDDNDSRLFPAMHFLGSRLNIEHLLKNIHRFERKLDQLPITPLQI